MTLATNASDALGRVSFVAKIAGTVVVCAAIWFSTGDLAHSARWTLLIFWCAIAAWLLTPWDDALIALAAAVALVAAGGASEADFRATLGAELIWLLIAAFMIAGAIRSTQLVERFTRLCLSRAATVAQTFHALTAVIGATAILIPSTSARAAMLLPICLHLLKITPDAGARTALALLFPTVILLSACGVLTGAGAHLIAIDLLAQTSSTRIDYFYWLVLCLPIAVITSHAAAHIILHIFAQDSATLRLHSFDADPPSGAMTAPERYVFLVVLVTLALWMTTSLHGLSLSLIAVASAVALSIRPLSGVSFKSSVNAVDWRLILFLAATLFLGQAMLTSGAGRWIADGMIDTVPSAARTSVVVGASIVIVIALLSHLVIVSRSARAAVLIPAFALPFAALGYAPEAVVMLTVVGTGFCQTFAVSAKPVMIYSGLEGAPFTHRDLLRLSCALLPMMFLVLLAFAAVIWPLLGFSFAR